MKNWYKNVSIIKLSQSLMSRMYGYGAWLAPDGELIPVEYQQHAYVAADIVRENELPIHNLTGSDIVSYHDVLFAHDYVRLVFEGNLSIEYKTTLTSRQIYVIKNLIQEYLSEDPNDIIFINDSLVTGEREAMSKIRNSPLLNN